MFLQQLSTILVVLYCFSSYPSHGFLESSLLKHICNNRPVPFIMWKLKGMLCSGHHTSEHIQLKCCRLHYVNPPVYSHISHCRQILYDIYSALRINVSCSFTRASSLSFHCFRRRVPPHDADYSIREEILLQCWDHSFYSYILSERQYRPLYPLDHNIPSARAYAPFAKSKRSKYTNVVQHMEYCSLRSYFVQNRTSTWSFSRNRSLFIAPPQSSWQQFSVVAISFSSKDLLGFLR